MLAVAAAVACGGESNAPTRDDHGAVVAPGRVDVGELTAGDCFDDPARDTLAALVVLPCDEPHQVEVVGFVELADGDYPGRDRAEELGRAECDGVLADYLMLEPVPGGAAPTTIDSTDLVQDTFVPTESSWKDGDRTVICLTFLPDKSAMTSSVRGAGR